MGLHEEFEKSVDWIEKNLKFDQTDAFVSLIHVNSHVLGGLMSAYELSNCTILLEKAKELGEIMGPAFENREFPQPYYNFFTGQGKSRKALLYYSQHGPMYGGDQAFIPEIAGFQLEFTALSSYFPSFKSKNIGKTLLNSVFQKFPQGLLPDTIYYHGSNTSTYSISESTSIYSSLIKETIHTSKKNIFLKAKSEYLIYEIIEKLLQQDISGMYYLSVLQSQELLTKVSHSTCAFPGLLALAVSELKLLNSDRLFTIAKELTYTCYMINKQSCCGLAPDTVQMSYGIKYPWFIGNYYLLGSETLESIMYLYYYTRDDVYREWAWNIFVNIEKYAKNPNGYAGITNVNKKVPVQMGCTPNYFFSGTLKYLYLIFSEDPPIDLKRFVVSSAGHPFIIKS